MGLFGRKQQTDFSDLPELIEEGDPLIGRQARDNDGHAGRIDAVYRFSDGSKRVDIRNSNGAASCALTPEEYTIEPTYYTNCSFCSGQCTGH